MYTAIGAVLIAWSLVHVVAALATIPSAARCSRDNEVHEWWSQVKKDIDSAESSPLHVAAKTGNMDMADALIERSAYVNERDQYGRTTLHWAAKNGHVEMVEFLVKKGADVNIKDKIGWTPLMHAEHNGNLETIEYLKKVCGGSE